VAKRSGSPLRPALASPQADTEDHDNIFHTPPRLGRCAPCPRPPLSVIPLRRCGSAAPGQWSVPQVRSPELFPRAPQPADSPWFSGALAAVGLLWKARRAPSVFRLPLVTYFAGALMLPRAAWPLRPPWDHVASASTAQPHLDTRGPGSSAPCPLDCHQKVMG